MTLVREVREDALKNRKSHSLDVPTNSVVAAKREEVGHQCTLSVQVGALSLDNLVLIARNLNQECLLGADFFDKAGLYC